MFVLTHIKLQIKSNLLKTNEMVTNTATVAHNAYTVETTQMVHTILK